MGVIPTCSVLWTSGNEFKALFDATLQEDYAGFGSRETHTLIISDHYETYWAGGPITSFSFGCGGVLTLKSQTPGKGVVRNMEMC